MLNGQINISASSGQIIVREEFDTYLDGRFLSFADTVDVERNTRHDGQSRQLVIVCMTKTRNDSKVSYSFRSVRRKMLK